MYYGKTLRSNKSELTVDRVSGGMLEGIEVLHMGWQPVGGVELSAEEEAASRGATDTETTNQFQF